MNRFGAAVWFHNGRRYYATVVRVAAVAEGEDRTTLVLCFAGLPSTPSKTEKKQMYREYVNTLQVY